MRLSAALLPTLVVAVIGCGSSTDESPPAPPDPVDPSASWPTLISADWTIPAGTEGYVCARHTVQEDLFVAGFAAIASPGAHHAMLTMGLPDAPDGVGPCEFATVFAVTVFAVGAVAEPLQFPPGVATKIPKGAQLLLNVHLLNSDENELSGSSGARALMIPESELVERAEHFAAVMQLQQIPARAMTTHIGHCTMRSDLTLVAVAPHMHTLGRHEKVVAESASGEITLLDASYTFGEQSYSVLEPVKMANGDRLRVECTHENTTDEIVAAGPRSQDEMCMASFYKYPVGGSAGCLED